MKPDVLICSLIPWCVHLKVVLVILDFLAYHSEFSLSWHNSVVEHLVRYLLVNTEFVMAVTLWIHQLCCGMLILHQMRYRQTGRHQRNLQTGILQNSFRHNTNVSININSQNAVIYCQTSRFLHLPLWYSTFPSRIFGTSHHLSLFSLASLIHLFSLLHPWSEGAGIHRAYCWCLSSLSCNATIAWTVCGLCPDVKAGLSSQLPCEPSSVGYDQQGC